MFDLTDSIREDIIFAMENQNVEFAIDADSGSVVELDSLDDSLEDVLEDGYESEAGLSGHELLDPPDWSPADGFKLMEAFARSLGDPLAHTALAAALARGRGVFRAFKDTLAEFPEAERRWFSYKTAAMGKRVDDWFRATREARGLESLGPEPEDTEDLLAGEYSVRRTDRSAWTSCRELFNQGLTEALDAYPEALVEYEYTGIDREISLGDSGRLDLFLAEAAAGALAAVAVVRTVFVADRSFGKLVYLYVDPDHRRMGLGRALAEGARKALQSEGVKRFIVDLPFLPEGFGKSLAGFGYQAFGTRWITSSD